jgi:Domain of unknown function (DUF4387)/Acyclic terpene utilisation family protein AtuA
MSNLVYRVVSPCCVLGYGFPPESFETALDGRVDAIVCDAGSVDAGPFFLGTGGGYFSSQEVRADLERIIAAAHRIGCPVIIGSAGLGGGDRNVAAVVSLFVEVFAQLGIQEAKVATISSEVPAERVIAEFNHGTLWPLGQGIALNEETLRQSTIVGQMGVHPIMSALAGGAQYVIAGRACDAAIFAADMIRRGISPGLAYHVGHVLECGAIACEPASPSDCLVAEIYDDGSAVFVAPNPQRRCTVHSIAAHSLYEEAHPQLQVYPEGILNTEATEFHAKDARVAGIRGSRLVRGSARLSIKLEGARRLGYRKVSLLYIDPQDTGKIPADLLVYGRNGVQLTPGADPTREMGIIIETTAATQESAMLLAGALRHHLCQFAYPGRRGTAGNIAHPLSPHALAFRRGNGTFGALIPCGTADPAFFKLLRRIEVAIVEGIDTQTPQAFAYASHVITTLDSTYPAVLVTTVDSDQKRLNDRHAADIARVTAVAQIKPISRLNLDAPDAYEWSLFHILQNEQTIREELFPITHYQVNGRTWTETAVRQPAYAEIATSDPSCSVDPLTLSVIDDVDPQGVTLGSQRLVDMAAVIRSKNSGITRLTFDLFFNSGENYEAALLSNAFCRVNIARTLHVPLERIVGTYFADSCNAIKITIDRPVVAASLQEHDLYGEQQQAALEDLNIPIYSRALATSSAF